jgi:histidine ammonia-lyase
MIRSGVKVTIDMSSAEQTIFLDGETLTLEVVRQVSENPAIRVQLAPGCLDKIRASRKVVEDVLASGKIVYGVNTGFGALSNVSISNEQVDQLQVNLVRSHAAGTGVILDFSVVRAMMLLRANTLAKGFSGVRPEVVETLLALLNQGVYPKVPSKGSLGASGDLAPLAHMTLVLLGEGEAYYQGEWHSGAEALKRAGIQPLTLKAKEGLALLNGTQMMTAVGTLALLQAETLLSVAEVAGAMTIEAVKGSQKPFDARIAQARAHVGHAQSAAVIRNLLAGSEIMESHRDCAKVQDAYSLRCIPQVHGAARDLIASVRKTLSVEINSATDNPLVFPNGDIISQGNFHGEPVAMAMEQLALALCELGSISERRIDKLMNPVFSELPAFLAGSKQGAGLNSGMMIIHYTAASLVSESKVLAHPAVVDTIPTSNDKEDHVSMGATAARKATQILEHTRWVLAAELLAAAEGLEYRDGLKPGDGVWRVYQKIRQSIQPLVADRTLAGDVAELVCQIEDGSLLADVQALLVPAV